MTSKAAFPVAFFSRARFAVKSLTDFPRGRRGGRKFPVRVQWQVLCDEAAKLGYNEQELLLVMILLDHAVVRKLPRSGERSVSERGDPRLSWSAADEAATEEVTAMPEAGDEWIVCNTAPWLREVLGATRSHGLRVLWRDPVHVGGGRTLVGIDERPAHTISDP